MTVRLGPRFLVGLSFITGAAVAIAIVLALAGDGSAGPPARAEVTVEVLDEPTTVAALAPTATPEPAPAPQVEIVPRSCQDILASGFYLTPDEKLFFQDNCRTSVASTSSNSTSDSSGTRSIESATSAEQQASTVSKQDLRGLIEFTGGVWATVPVPYCVNPSNPPVRSNGQPLISGEQFAAYVQTAFRRWHDIPGASISFAYQGICGNDPWNNTDGVNTVGWGWLFGSAIGLSDPSQTHGRFLRQNSAGQMFEVDIVIDVRYAQSFDDPSQYLDWRLQSILTHEAGHFIGLGHSNDSCSIMQPVIAQVADLCWIEIAAVQALYP